MKISLPRQNLQTSLQNVLGSVENKQTMQILSNVMLDAREGQLTITGTDLELELVCTVDADCHTEGRTTVNARKLNDIIRSAPLNSIVHLTLENEWLTIDIERSHFKLATLNANDFPTAPEPAVDAMKYALPESTLRRMIDNTAMSMAQQDVRYYLNGMLIEMTSDALRCVTTDGHRMAFSEFALSLDLPQTLQFIVPRKAVLELARLLNENNNSEIEISLDSRQLQIHLNNLRFTTKLIDGRYPDYQRVIPNQYEMLASLDRQTLKSALNRAAVLSQDKFPGARFNFNKDYLRIETHNNDQESSVEELPIEFDGEPFNIGFNIKYLSDIISVIRNETVLIELRDAESSALIRPVTDDITKDRYILMPMKL